MPWMLSANFLAGIHFLPVPARLELRPCGRKIQHKHFGDGEWAEALGIMSRKPARVVEEARDKSLHNNETLYLNVRARVGNRKPSSFSANPLSPGKAIWGTARGDREGQKIHRYSGPQPWSSRAKRPRSWASLQTSLLLSPENLSYSSELNSQVQPTIWKIHDAVHKGLHGECGDSCVQTHPDWGQIPG